MSDRIANARRVATLAVAGFVLAVAWQVGTAVSGLPGSILRTGRIALGSPPADLPLRDRATLGGPRRASDGDTNTAAVLRVGQAAAPAYLLIDLGLSHWPPKDRPRPRQPQLLTIYNGSCSDCSREEFVEYGRVRRATVEFYRRQANNPDREFRHMPTLLVRRYEVELPDRPGKFSVALQLPPAAASPGYPEGVYYLVGKLIVREVYPGRLHPQSVAIAELLYADSDATLQTKVPPHYWR